MLLVIPLEQMTVCFFQVTNLVGLIISLLLLIQLSAPLWFLVSCIQFIIKLTVYSTEVCVLAPFCVNRNLEGAQNEMVYQ